MCRSELPSLCVCIPVSFSSSVQRCPDRQPLAACGGKFLNIFATPLSKCFSFFSALLETRPSAPPRPINFFSFASYMSTTRVPSLDSFSVVVSSPPPPHPRPLHPP